MARTINKILEEKSWKRTPPANLTPKYEQLFSMNSFSNCRSVNLIFEENIFVNRELLIFKKNHIFNESFVWNWQRKMVDSIKGRLIFLIKNYLIRRTKKIEKAVWCLDNYTTGGYYHWIVEVAPRLWIAREHMDNAVFFVPDYMWNQWFYVKDVIKALGVKNIQIISNNEKYLVKELIIATQTGGPLEYQADSLRGAIALLGEKNSKPKLKKWIYISRAKAKHRRVINEDELIPVLTNFGFEIVFFEELSWTKQIEICSQSEIMVGMHGAGLTNMVFMDPGSIVVELRQNLISHELNCFYTLADTIGHLYYFNCGEYQEVKETGRVIDRSLYFEPIPFKKLLSELISSKSSATS
jgi:hypothetical protein